MDTLPPVMLVDDNHDDLFILKRLLTRGGVKNAFMTFDHGRDAARFLDAATRTPDTQLIPAAIFADKEMSEFHGFDLLMWVRAQPGLAKLPFILLTSAAQPDDEARAMQLGATFFEKFPPQQVLRERSGVVW